MKQPIDISVDIANLHLKNPLILASGLLGLDCGSLERVGEGGASAVTMKSLTSEPRKGHNNPILIECEAGLMNAVGYGNKGIVKGVEEFKKWKQRVPLIGSIVAQNADEFAELAMKIQEVPISALEIVLSCPHTPGYGVLAGQGTPEATKEITRKVRKVTTLPLLVKLSPSSEKVGEIAKAAESEGADAINMGNTLGPGMKIDLETRQPVLDFKVGGMSGPAIKPIMIRSVSDIYQSVKIPVIATGGITTGDDVVEAFMAGASAVEMGSALYYRGIDVFQKVEKEIEQWLIHHNVDSITELTGAIHEKRRV